MRLLYVTNGFPFPLTSGYLRHYHLLSRLGRRHDVTLLSLAGASYEPEHAEALAGFVRDVHVFRAPDRSRSARRAGRAAGLVAGRRAPEARDLARAAAELLERERFDAAVLSGKDTVAALPALARLALVVDVCDAASLRRRRELAVAPPFRRPALLLAYRRARAIERLLVATADELLFAAARDRAALALPRAAGARTTIVPNGVDLDYWRRSSARLGRNSVVLTGAMHYAPNADAGVVLAREVMPRVRAHVPAARLTLVGRDPTPAVRALAGDPCVTVTGFVDDVRPYLERASVLAAPIRAAAGIQNKLLEALAMEVPAVASRAAAEGLLLEPGDALPLRVADTLDDVAVGVVDALRRADEDGSPHAASRAWVGKRFSWERAADAVEAALERALGRRRLAAA